MVDFLRRTKRCGLWAGMGIGKSSAALYTIDLLQLLGDIDPRNPTLVIGPMRVARDTWPEEVAKWSQFQHLKIIALTGTPEQRLGKLQRKADIYTISYELAPWLVEHYLAKWPFRQVIADESDRLKGFREKAHGTNLNSKKSGASGERAHQIGRIAHNLVDRWINLTGTPAPAGLKDLWGQTWYLDRGHRLGRTHTAFTHRWFRKKFSGYGIEPMPHSDAEIHKLLGDICLTVDPKDYFDLKDPIRSRIEVKLPPAARKIYRELELKMYVELEALGAEINAMNSAALTAKCLQMAGGAVYTQHPEWVYMHNAKLEALESIAHESGGMPLLVAYQFGHERDRILKTFPGAVNISTKDGLAAFKAGDASMGVAHPKSMGHGIDGLQYVTNTLVFFGHDWKTGERMQFIERIGPMRQLQAELDRNVFIYDIVATDTEDEHVMEVHDGNKSVQDVLLAAMNRRKNAHPTV